MSRSARNKAKTTAEEPPQQLQDLVFNSYGHAFEHGISERQHHLIVNAYGHTTTSWKDHVKKEGMDTVSRPSISATNRELGEASVGMFPYLVVGLVPPLRYLTSNIFKKSDDKRNQQGVGTERPSNIISLAEDEVPMLAVTPVTEDEPVSVKLHRETFYFSEFRDATTSRQLREANWNRLVLIHSVKASIGKTPSAKQEKIKRAKDTTKLVSEPNQSLINEVAFLAQAFSKSRDPWHLHAIQRLLSDADEDPNCQPATPNTAMRKFTTPGSNFDEAEALNMIEEFTEHWPDVQGLTVERLMALKNGLEGGEELLEYRLLRGFVAEGMEQLRGMDDTTDLTDITSSLIATVRRIIGPTPKPIASVSLDSDVRALVALVRAKLEEVVNAGRRFDTKLKGLHGDQAMPHSISDVWATFGNACDIDSAKLAFNHVAKYHSTALRHKEAGLEEMLLDIIEVLSHFDLPKDT